MDDWVHNITNSLDIVKTHQSSKDILTLRLTRSQCVLKNISRRHVCMCMSYDDCTFIAQRSGVSLIVWKAHIGFEHITLCLTALC